MEDRPAPLIPAEVDLRGFEWFPIYPERVRTSKWWRRASHLARSINFTLWCAAWRSVPAGSLPDDDDDLADAAGFGFDTAAFQAVKAEVMAPWTLCNDGRFYHPTVCEMAIGAWARLSEERRKGRERQARFKAKVRQKSHDDGGGNALSSPGNALLSQNDASSRSRGEERKDNIGKSRDGSPPQSKPKPKPKGSKFVPADWPLSEALRAHGRSLGLSDAKIDLEASKFRNHEYRAPKLDFDRAFRAWLVKAAEFSGATPKAPKPEPEPEPETEADASARLRRRVEAFKRDGHWREEWGPRPTKPGCTVPPGVLAEFGFAPGAEVIALPIRKANP